MGISQESNEFEWKNKRKGPIHNRLVLMAVYKSPLNIILRQDVLPHTAT
jgi:hypothetical protein